MLRRYEACLTGLDQQIGNLLESLSQQGLLENTLVVITADHGESFGEHGVFYHSNALYVSQVHVPLVISYPGVLPSGHRYPGIVSLADLPATVMDLLGFDNSHPFHRRSLRDRIAHGATESTAAAPIVTAALGSKGTRLEASDRGASIETGSLRSAISDTHQYVLNGDGSEELYAYGQDPDEEHNLASSSENAELLSRMRHVAKSIPLDPLRTITDGDKLTARWLWPRNSRPPQHARRQQN